MKTYYIFKVGEEYLCAKQPTLEGFHLVGEFEGEETTDPIDNNEQWEENIVICLIYGEHVRVATYKFY